jgi:simple sugar transport system substrate-binding protein
MRVSKLVVLVVLALAVAIPAFSFHNTNQVKPIQAQDDEVVIGLAVHDDPTGSFWNVVDRGAHDAADELGITLISNGSKDPLEQAQIIDDYVAQGVDGIIVSLANPDALSDSVTAAIEAGIPVITINSGVGVYKELGALTHVGQTEFVAGQGAGERFNELGATKVLCVIHEEGNIGLEERCDGLEDTFEGEVERFNVALTGAGDLVGTSGAIQDKLLSDDSIDGILSLNPDIATAAWDAMQAAGTEQILGTFDLSPDILQAIVDGNISFAIDQQQYMQGYLPVVFLHLYIDNLNVVGGGNPVLTGPGFVDSSNAAQVIELSAGGTR